MKKLLHYRIVLTLLSVLLSLLISSCTTPPDKPVCTEINPTKAFCTYTIQDKDFYWSDSEKYEGKTFYEARPSMLLVPVSTWVEIKTYIIKMCRQNNQCSNVTSWDRKIQTIDNHMGN